MTNGDAPTESRRPSAWRSALDLATTVVMLCAAVVILWNLFTRNNRAAEVRPSVPLPTEPLAFNEVPVLGSSASRVMMMIFSDFECPFCARFANETLPTLKERYVDTGLVRLAFRHLPLVIHRRAIKAAESAECAARQGRFWVMHDVLFRPPMRLEEADLIQHAVDAELDLQRFRDCMQGEANERVTADSQLALELGFSGTPAFIVGHVTDAERFIATDVLVGARPAEDFAGTLDRAISSAQ